jgi:hypothetical protein
VKRRKHCNALERAGEGCTDERRSSSSEDQSHLPQSQDNEAVAPHATPRAHIACYWWRNKQNIIRV